MLIGFFASIGIIVIIAAAIAWSSREWLANWRYVTVVAAPKCPPAAKNASR